MRVLVTEPLSERGLELLRKDFQVDVRPELARGDLALEIAPYDALIVRSQTKVTADIIEAAQNLKVIARAGIGLDNVDVEAATRRGVMVVNAPQSNIVSAAEHTVALMLAQARNIPQANAALKAGRWEREWYQGVELAGKTVGVVGLGRVGSMVAQRCAAFGMRVTAFRLRPGRRDAAPRRVDRGGPGQGGRLHRRAGPARADGRVRTPRGERLGRGGGLGGGAAVPAARREARDVADRAGPGSGQRDRVPVPR